MNPERLALVEEIFLAAAEVHGPAREAVLRARCGDDPSLRAEVESLLSHDDGTADQVLDVPLVAPSVLPRNLVESDGPTLTPGTRVGSYTIEEVLGAGGMGVVYLAHQEGPSRKVALKLLRPGVASGALLRRIELEAELLGRLKHPGIAQIYESGRADYGLGPQPFFAMELVDGPPLNRYAQEHGLAPRARLELVVKLCHAVEHAHQKGVIHRDLKPGNILVDATGQPKVLDFGVARATDADLRVTTLRTGVGQLIGTLPYMSPEQVQGSPEEMDTRSDVYSIGVILYELLTGRLPHKLDSRSIPDAARIIREVEPARLGSVNRSLRGDVETIVAKAMEKNKDRRYQSAAALADDLRRFLDGDPIEAKKDSAIYLLRKHLRRYRALAAGVCLIVIGLSAFSLYASRQAELNRQLVLKEREAVVQAEFLRGQAERQSEQLRRSGYFTRIGFAQAALAAHDSNRMIRVLEDCPLDLRGWEWRYLKRLSDASTATMKCQPPGIASASVSGSGTRLVSWAAGVGDAQLNVWDCATRARIARIPAGTNTGDVALDLAGERCAIVRSDGRAEMWAVGETTPLWDRRVMRGALHTCELSADGRTLAVAGQPDTAFLLDAQNGAVIQRLAGGGGDVRCIALSADASRVATGDSGGEVRVFDAATGAALAVHHGHKSEVRAVAFSPDGSRLASCGNDEALRVWNRTAQGGWRAGSGYRVHDNKVASLAFSRDGKRLASAGTESIIQVLDLDTAEIVQTLNGHSQTIIMLAFTPDDRTILSAARDGTVKWWDVASTSAEPRAAAAGMVLASAMSPDGKTLYTGLNSGPVQSWSLPDLTPVEGFSHPGAAIRGLAVSPDNSKVAVGALGPGVALIDARTGAFIRRVVHPTAMPQSVGFLDSERFAVSYVDGWIKVFDATTGQLDWGKRADPVNGTVLICEARGKRGNGPVSEDRGRGRIAMGVAGGAIAVLDGDDGSELLRLPGHTRETTSLLFLDHGLKLASTGADALARVWDLATGREVAVLRGHTVTVNIICVSPDGSRLATGSQDNTIKLWDAATGTEVLTLRYHNGGVQGLHFTPDGRGLVSASDDGSIRYWGD